MCEFYENRKKIIGYEKKQMNDYAQELQSQSRNNLRFGFRQTDCRYCCIASTGAAGAHYSCNYKKVQVIALIRLLCAHRTVNFMRKRLKMNRQEHRRQKLDSKPKTYTLTDAQIKQIKADAIAQASSKTFVAMLGLPLVALRKFDFEKEQLERFEEELLRQYKCFEQGYITLDELKQIIRDETGMEVFGE